MSYTVAVDWDGTITAHPALWAEVIQVFQRHEATVIIITNRPAAWPVEQDLGIPVLYAAGRPKRAVAAEAGYNVHWWCDDLPILVDLGAAGLDVETHAGHEAAWREFKHDTIVK